MTKNLGREKSVQVGDEAFTIATTGHDGQERFMGMLTRRDIKPFAQQAFVHGTMTGDVFYADEVGILEKTRAKLIYVTTCPVPGGYPPAPDPEEKDGETKAAGIPERDLLPERQRPSTRGMDTQDYLALLASDARLRQHND